MCVCFKIMSQYTFMHVMNLQRLSSLILLSSKIYELFLKCLAFSDLKCQSPLRQKSAGGPLGGGDEAEEILD